MRASRYNILFPSAVDGRALIVNTMYCLTLEVTSAALGFLDCPPTDLEKLTGRQRREVRRLIDSGMLIDDSIDELLILRYRRDRFKYRSRVMQLTIAPTLACNFACPYCFEQRVGEGDPGPSDAVMTPDTQSALADFVNEAAPGLRRLHVTWFGGEPLLVPDIVLSLSDRLRETACREDIEYTADMVTNGYLLDARPDLVKRLKEVGIGSIQVTLDGPPALHDARRKLKADKGGTFARILANVKLLVSEEVPVLLRISVDETNRAGIEELLDILTENGLTGPRVYPAPIIADTPGCVSFHGSCMCTAEFHRFRSALIDKLLARGLNASLLRRTPDIVATSCDACLSRAFVIDPDGFMYKCWQEVGDREMSVGNIRTYDEGLDRTAKMREIRWLTWDPFEYGACRECRLLPICLGLMCPYGPLTSGGPPECCSWKTDLDGLRRCVYSAGSDS